MAEVISLDEHFTIVAESNRGGVHRVLKHGDTFGVFDFHGDVQSLESGEQGLYHAGTRFLSRFELLLGRRRPLLLSSAISEDNTILAVDLTNPDVVRGDQVIIPRGSLHIFRARTLWNGHSVERIRFSNHSRHTIRTPLGLHFDADFRDVFEVRGTRRERRGRRGDDGWAPDHAVLRYEGLDRLERQTVIGWHRSPSRSEDGAVLFSIVLEPQETIELEIAIACEISKARSEVRYTDIIDQSRQAVAEREICGCRIVSSHEGLNRWLNRS